MHLENVKQLEHFTIGKSYVLKRMQYTEDLVIENDLGERKRLDLKAATISEIDRTELRWLGTYFNFISDENEMPIVRQTRKQKRIVTQVKVGSWISLGLVCLLISYLFRFINTWTNAYTFFLSDFLFFSIHLLFVGAFGVIVYLAYERLGLAYVRRKSGLPMRTLRMEHT